MIKRGPNLQNLTKRTPLGEEIREAFTLGQRGSMMAAAELLVQAVEALPLAQWVSVKERRPKKGEEVLIWPRNAVKASEHTEYYPVTAFYGTRYSAKGGFYMYGRVLFPTHWMPLPKGPQNGE